MCGGGGAPQIVRPEPEPEPPPPPRLASKNDIKDANGETKKKRRGRKDLVIDLLPNDQSGTGLSIPK